MKILITGATGFVGSVLVPRLIDRVGADRIAVFVLPHEALPLTYAQQPVEVIRGDIVDAAAVARACQSRTHVIHMAALISYWRRDLERLTAVNVAGVRHVVAACLASGVERLVHISSVGAIGFHKSGALADETTPYNWPADFYYMTTKFQGQQVVETAVAESALPAIILNPASIMGPGDWNIATPHNQLYKSIYAKTMVGSFAGGLAVVDVRDLCDLIVLSLEQGRLGERYLAVGANVPYADVIRAMARFAGRKAYPWRIPAFVFTAAGAVMEAASDLTRKRPLLTTAYGRLSGWYNYYSNAKSVREFRHAYIPFEQTIEESCRYFERTFHPGH
jgi:dihydroflavonol-4-reductase